MAQNVFTGNLPRRGKKDVKVGKLVGIGCAAAAAMILLAASAAVVPAGHTGVVVTLGKVSENTMSEGFHLKVPFVQTVEPVSNQIQVYEVDAPAVSKDLQTVSSTIAVNYRVQSSASASIYRNIGADYQSVVLMPAVQESVKSVTAQFTAEQLITERTTVGEAIKENLAAKVSEYGLQIEKFNIVNFDFSEEFNAAIEQKQVAEQNLLKTQTEQEQAIVIAEAEAKKQVIAAEAAAKAIMAEAQAQADANELINNSLTELILQNKMLEQWDGQLPMVNGADSSLLLGLDVNEVAQKQPTANSNPTE
ncbi:MAG: prohibitin family protein [Oscillospiraceae bacterium]